MNESAFDVLIIGGGPGGSAAATFLAKAGKKVLLLEKEVFPRFHIGESLLPYNRRIFDELGVMPALQAAGFPRKLGAQFHLGNNTKNIKLVFSNGKFTREPEAFQVERATFDHILLKHARSCGAEVREGWTVSRFAHENGGVKIEARPASGEMETFRASFLIDASGRGNLTGNQEKQRIVNPSLKKIAVFGHFKKV
ncbi:MAG: tryptophan 7-halogenase, partial [Verrucomicrobiota bacterium]